MARCERCERDIFDECHRCTVADLMLGLTFTRVDGGVDSEELRFVGEDGKDVLFFHSQNCCEHVRVYDIVGDLGDLVGSTILLAEEVTGAKEPHPKGYDTVDFTWTFYKFATVRGAVTIRWLGESSGWYSEKVEFAEVLAGEYG